MLGIKEYKNKLTEDNLCSKTKLNCCYFVCKFRLVLDQNALSQTQDISNRLKTCMNLNFRLFPNSFRFYSFTVISLNFGNFYLFVSVLVCLGSVNGREYRYKGV